MRTIGEGIDGDKIVQLTRDEWEALRELARALRRDVPGGRPADEPVDLGPAIRVIGHYASGVYALNHLERAVVDMRKDVVSCQPPPRCCDRIDHAQPCGCGAKWASAATM